MNEPKLVFIGEAMMNCMISLSQSELWSLSDPKGQDAQYLRECLEAIGKEEYKPRDTSQLKAQISVLKCDADLLIALEELLVYTYEPGCDALPNSGVESRARAAIAKAKGE
jgi:hypothetical protein